MKRSDYNRKEDEEKEGLSWWQFILLIILGIIVLNLSGLIDVVKYVFPI